MHHRSTPTDPPRRRPRVGSSELAARRARIEETWRRTDRSGPR